MEYQNLVGKLLAGENLKIVHKNMETAAFDIKNRTLYLPIWKDMTPEINDMLICHEVSHALFTPMDYVDAINTRLKFRNARSYLNILEDIRAEKMIKRRYPGIKKSFLLGYKQLNDKDFFGLKKKNLKEAHLMDKINLYYKVGVDCGVEFNEEEKVFVDRAFKTENINDVIKLAEDIFKYLKEKKEDKKGEEEESKNGSNGSPNDDSESGEFGEGGGSSDEYSDDQGDDSAEGSSDDHGDGAESGSDGAKEGGEDGEDDEDGEVVSDSSFTENSKDLVNNDEEWGYVDIAPKCKDRVVKYGLLIQTIKRLITNPFYERELIDIKNFYASTKPTVDYLVKEFELKKAATAYKRNTIAKSGAIDMQKLYAYQIKDDLFKKINITKNGKNHGMVMLLDWSGSMEDVMRKTLIQVVTLAMFCRQINIPFQVLAFANGRPPKEWQEYYAFNVNNDKNTVSGDRGAYYLVELLSSKMNNMDFKFMVSHLITHKVRSVFGLQGTPLTEALLYMHHHLKGWTKEHNVEKLSFIVLTDGQGSTFGYFSDNSYVQDETGKQRCKKKRWFLNNKKGATLSFGSDAASQTSALLASIKINFNCNVIGFYVLQESKSHVSEFVQYNYSKEFYTNEFVDKLYERVKSEDFVCLTDIPGRDRMFLLPTTMIKVYDEELKIKDGASIKKITSDFNKHMSKKITSRVLLNKFIEIIA